MKDFSWYIEIKGKKWRRGVTTGACAAAAAKAAVLVLGRQRKITTVEIRMPGGATAVLPVGECRYNTGEALCGVTKDAGDDPDITDGIIIHALARWTTKPGITVKGGEGVGIVTKPGLQIPVGEAAINPVPRRMIEQVVADNLGTERGVEIIISVPRGAAIARKTLNSMLGIEGGISILGTTGIVEPMSEEAYKYSLVPQIDVALAAGRISLFFTPGKIGQHLARRYNIPVEHTILTSNFIGYMLHEAAFRGVKNIVLFGHIGKLVKLAGGIFHTHSKIADGRMEIIAAHAAVMGGEPKLIAKLLDCVTTEAVLPLIAEAGLNDIYSRLAERASQRAAQYTQHQVRIGTMLLSLQGKILGMDNNAREIGDGIGWRIR